MNMKYQKLKIVVWSMWSDVQIQDTCGELMQITERWYSLYSEMNTCIFYVPRSKYCKQQFLTSGISYSMLFFLQLNRTFKKKLYNFLNCGVI